MLVHNCAHDHGVSSCIGASLVLEIESTMLVHKELVALLVLASYPGRVKALVRGYIGASLVTVKNKIVALANQVLVTLTIVWSPQLHSFCVHDT